MQNNVILSDLEIEEVKSLSKKTRKLFGIHDDVPIANDMKMLLEKQNIILCEYPFQSDTESHTDATITRIELGDESLVFIGLNTALYYDEQIFALAHELYHYQTHTGKAYSDMEIEDSITEKKADRYAAELLLPGEALKSIVINEFKNEKINIEKGKLRILRFIARIQSEWWLPYRSILVRLKEEGYMSEDVYKELFLMEHRNPDSEYSRLFKSIDNRSYEILYSATNNKAISVSVLECVIKNYESNLLTDDEFATFLKLLDKNPEEFGYDISVSEDEDIAELFESGEADED